ncbi:MAG TPA: hypothetical protein VE258_05350 [Ktedonobacterales bacterium]|nr:hypothetical protein [Ktedonobacterales bacterium]
MTDQGQPLSPIDPRVPNDATLLIDRWEHRHPNVVHLLRFFDSRHLPAELQAVASHLEAAADELLRLLGDGPELAAGLRKLLEAKDCFVRAAL